MTDLKMWLFQKSNSSEEMLLGKSILVTLEKLLQYAEELTAQFAVKKRILQKCSCSEKLLHIQEEASSFEKIDYFHTFIR